VRARKFFPFFPRMFLINEGNVCVSIMYTRNSSIVHITSNIALVSSNIRCKLSLLTKISYNISSRRTNRTIIVPVRTLSSVSTTTSDALLKNEVDTYADFSKAPGWKSAGFGVYIYPNFITDHEHTVLCTEVEPLLKKRHLETNHWDGVIQGYKEIPRSLLQVSPFFANIAQRIQAQFPQPSGTPMNYVHILDLAAEPEGRIDGHVDSIKFSGSIVAGLCLLSPAIMRLSHETSSAEVDLHLPPYCLYILTGEARYYWKHAIISGQGQKLDSSYQPLLFKGKPIIRNRRISLMFRDELEEIVAKLPSPQQPQS